MHNNTLIYQYCRAPIVRSAPASPLRHAKPIEILQSLTRSVLDKTSLPLQALGGAILTTRPNGEDQTGDLASALLRTLDPHHPFSSWMVGEAAGSLAPLVLGDALIRAGSATALLVGAVDIHSRDAATPSQGVYADPSVLFATALPHPGVYADFNLSALGLSRANIDQVTLRAIGFLQRRQQEAAPMGLVPITTPAGDVMIRPTDDIAPPTPTSQQLDAAEPLFKGHYQFGHGQILKFITDNAGEFPSLHSQHHVAGKADGAGLLLLGSDSFAATTQASLKPVARVLACASSMGTADTRGSGALAAALACLKIASIPGIDINHIAVDDEFAVTPLLFSTSMVFQPERINRHGGFLASGRPGAAAGMLLLGSLLDALAVDGGGIGLAAVNGENGSGTAVLIQMM